MRLALYYTPEPGDPLLAAAEEWLGRSAFGHDVPTAGASDEALVADARRYGFHATIKAPFELAPGQDFEALDAACAEWAAGRAPVADVRLRLVQLAGFFALVPEAPHAGLDALAADVVRDFDRFRAPLSDADRARRASDRLTERQRTHLDRWGYPYVLEEFRFHMTLTRHLGEAEGRALRPELERRFGAFLGVPRDISTLAVFTEAERGGDFAVRGLHRMAGDTTRSAAPAGVPGSN